jgi:hypothetical protein
MRQKIQVSIQVAALVLVAIAPSLVAAQVSLQEQLEAQYTMVKMGADSSGPAVVEAGTILDIKKGGILGVPYGDVTLYPTKYQDGSIHSPNSAVMKGIGSLFSKANLANKQQNTRLFQVGEKVYPSKIAVSPSNDRVVLDIISCDSCNNVNPPTYYKSQVVFQFAKGYLATASPSQIEDTIAQVFTIDDSGGDQQQGGGNDQGNGQGNGNQDAQGGQGQQANQEPQTIQLGQSTDEVQAALGKPEKIVNLGAKQIYVYKDLKITFVKGKVTDVQ